MKQILNKQISSTIFLSFMNHLLMPLRGLTPRCPFPYWPSITMTLIRVCANTTTPQLPWQILTVTFLWHPLTCSPLIHSQLFASFLNLPHHFDPSLSFLPSVHTVPWGLWSIRPGRHFHLCTVPSFWSNCQLCENLESCHSWVRLPFPKPGTIIS